MAGKAVVKQPTSAFDFEIVEGVSDKLTTVVASSSQSSPWIDPATIKLRQRIGRGLFGDVWLATRHQATADYDEYHEVAVKMLHPMKEENINVVLDRLGNLFTQCQELQHICWLQGLSVINGKLCIVMKFYEGSVGDKMARAKEGKLSLPDVIRYGTDLARGIMELHTKEILILNLKPYNFLLNENDHAILGDIGIPYLLLGVPSLSSDMSRRLGTPNYMAPEQWQPEVRGPISFETDSWGFGCSIVEMLTGSQPWSGKSVDEIFKSIVKRQEKPHIPEGLPPAVERVIIGCFEYDFRNRPLMGDILHAFLSSQEAAYGVEGWRDQGSRVNSDKLSGSGYSKWLVLKDQLQIGDTVRSRKPPNSCKPENMEVPGGTIVGMERDTERNGFVLVRVHGIHDPLRVHGSTLERVTFGLAAGDWVRLKTNGKKHSSVGILHSIDRDGSIAVAFIGLEIFWKGNCSELQMAEAYCAGQFVRLKGDIFCPRFEWPRKRGGDWATGRICHVLPNGCLVVNFPGMLVFGDENSSFLADPAEVEIVSFDTCPGIVKKYQHLEDFHWAVRPLLVALGLFTAMKLGLFVGKKVRRSKVKKGRNPVIHIEGQQGDAQNAAWLPPKVANIIFREGASVTTTSR
ncbi:protein KINASE OF THE OUTER CHLOROPLAST MEMBRANE 1 [Nicotiana tabacum]|uniref:Protein KINASE OF THE OUTER CHLOROPLAST MEMBRANE 1 n=4 Tax=Nicotiana tabacum TaxID=4097 RepID=A0AC58TVZ6_TOBAC